VIGSSDGDDVMRAQAARWLPDLLIVDYRLAGERLGTDVIAGTGSPSIRRSGDRRDRFEHATWRTRCARAGRPARKPVLPADLR
jgi:hypothetical protein